MYSATLTQAFHLWLFEESCLSFSTLQILYHPGHEGQNTSHGHRFTFSILLIALEMSLYSMTFGFKDIFPK